MASKRNVQYAHNSSRIRALHMALISVVSVMNRPDVDQHIIDDAGISLDRALFPLLVGIERLGPIGIVDLAGRSGRDYTTVSRQVAKLESLDLVQRQVSASDARVRAVAVTRKGKTMTDTVDVARERRAQTLFAEWSEPDIDTLVSLLQRFAGELEAQALVKNEET